MKCTVYFGTNELADGFHVPIIVIDIAQDIRVTFTSDTKVPSELAKPACKMLFDAITGNAGMKNCEDHGEEGMPLPEFPEVDNGTQA